MSLRTLSVTPRARQQLAEHVNTIRDAGQPAAAERLIFRFFDTCDLLLSDPLAGRAFEAQRPELQQVRRVGIRGYAYGIFYEVGAEDVLVLAVLDRRASQAGLERGLS